MRSVAPWTPSTGVLDTTLDSPGLMTWHEAAPPTEEHLPATPRLHRHVLGRPQQVQRHDQQHWWQYRPKHLYQDHEHQQKEPQKQKQKLVRAQPRAPHVEGQQPTTHSNRQHQRHHLQKQRERVQTWNPPSPRSGSHLSRYIRQKMIEMVPEPRGFVSNFE